MVLQYEAILLIVLDQFLLILILVYLHGHESRNLI